MNEHKNIEGTKMLLSHTSFHTLVCGVSPMMHKIVKLKEKEKMFDDVLMPYS